MHRILQSYLRRLVNLTGSNRSILLTRLIADHFIDLHRFDYVNNQPSFSIIQQLIARKSKISLGKTMDSRDDRMNELSVALKRLDRTDKFIHEERGTRDLYVGWPFVRGKFSDGSLVRCPLIFFPVDLFTSGAEWHMRFRDDVNIAFNKSFLLAYAFYNQTSLDENLVEYVFDEPEKDSRIFRTELYQMLKDSPVEINFNQENFLDKLIPFENFKKQELESGQKNGELKLYPEAVIGIFPQAGSYLAPDYMNLIDNSKVQDIEEFFLNRSVNDDKSSASGSPYVYFLNKIKEDQTFTPFELDAYQENALKAVKRGNSIVVQGPPGSGKSQLICNLIADFIARGKKTLLVSQKKAALDVVYNRLKEKDLADFVGLVHDFRNDRKRIYDQITRQIDRLQDYKMKNNSLDAIQLERRYLQASHRIDQIVEEMEELKFALFDESECNISVKELYLTSNIYRPHINIKQEYKFFPFGEIEKFLPTLKIYAAYAIRFNKEEHPWKTRIPFKNYAMKDLKAIRGAIQDVRVYQAELADKTREVVGSPLRIEEGEAILAKEEKIKDLLRHLSNPVVFEFFRHMVSYKDNETDYLWVGTMERIVMECFKDAGPEATLKTQELGVFQEALQKRYQASKGFYNYLKWHLFSKDKALVRGILAANNLHSTKKDIHKLVRMIDNRLNLEHNLTKLRKYKTLRDIPELYEKESFESWFANQKKAILSKLIFSSLRNFKEFFNIQRLSYEELKTKLENLLHALREIPRRKEPWLRYLTARQIYLMLDEPHFADKLISSLTSDYEDLCDFDSLHDRMQPHETEVIHKLIDETEELSEEAIIGLFQNSVRLAWIEHIETKYPILRSVSSMRFELMQQEFQDQVREKMKISADIALLKSREQTYENIEFNRLNNQVTYRELKHQTTKKKKIWPIRKLFSAYYHELFRLLPCWMASPESVSAIFPMEQIFDLVIFDEASQCFVERGIPALYRGKQAVIAGDDKQLSPYDLYQVRWDENGDDEPALEVDSLLDLANQHLMQIMLKGHYRSQSPDLIEFSNRNFYRGSLKMLPDLRVMNSNEPAIHYIKVNGVWENNINHAEAARTVELVGKILNANPQKSIGIITFNYKQQNYIADLLDDLSSSQKLTIPSSLFIKNIENVQGDEKDIIIFSTGYAPDKNGKMIMQFGSLNQLNGENRLNVAVTRAREKIYVITSILPRHLKVEETRNEGPKMLKAYLNYALEVSKGNFRYEPEEQSNYSFDWHLKNKIKNLFADINSGLSFTETLPFSDLTVQDGDSYMGLLLTDDLLYHQSPSVKESHVYTPFNLAQKNWPYHRFFSREYWFDREAVRENVIRFIRNTEERNTETEGKS